MLRRIQFVLRKLRLPLLAGIVMIVAPMMFFFWFWVIARLGNVDPHDPNGEKFNVIRPVRAEPDNPYLGKPEWRPRQNTDRSRYLPVVPTGKPVEMPNWTLDDVDNEP